MEEKMKLAMPITLQFKEMMFRARPILEESITKLYSTNVPECLKVADFGCSSGPNTLMLVWDIIDSIDATCKHLNHKPPMFQVFLNDLPGNDFNTIFKSLPSFYERVKKEKGDKFGPCFIAGMPGTFYGRLFPNNFLHFVHCSYSLHWPSQVPEGLVSESGLPLNKGNTYIAKTSPQSVIEAYVDLFKKDFTLFLRSRAEEMIPGGHMVLTIMLSDSKANSSANQSQRFCVFELLGLILNDMVLEGKVEEAKLDQFNIPFHAPTAEEVRHVIETEGSFNIQRFETFEVAWDATMEDNNENSSFDKHARDKYVAKSLRVVLEPMLVSQFGDEIMDDLFERFGVKMGEYSEEEKGEYNMVVFMIKWSPLQ